MTRSGEPDVLEQLVASGWAVGATGTIAQA